MILVSYLTERICVCDLILWEKQESWWNLNSSCLVLTIYYLPTSISCHILVLQKLKTIDLTQYIWINGRYFTLILTYQSVINWHISFDIFRYFYKLPPPLTFPVLIFCIKYSSVLLHKSRSYTWDYDAVKNHKSKVAVLSGRIYHFCIKN